MSGFGKTARYRSEEDGFRLPRKREFFRDIFCTAAMYRIIGDHGTAAGALWSLDGWINASSRRWKPFLQPSKHGRCDMRKESLEARDLCFSRIWEAEAVSWLHFSNFSTAVRRPKASWISIARLEPWSSGLGSAVSYGRLRCTSLFIGTSASRMTRESWDVSHLWA